MSLLHARGLSLRYGAKVLLDGASFTLGHHDRVGLIGPNGSGKSTLMKILSSQIEPDAGSVQLVRRARAAYLPQELSELPPGSILEGIIDLRETEPLLDPVLDTPLPVAAPRASRRNLRPWRHPLDERPPGHH